MEEIPLYKSIKKNILVISGGGLKGFSGLGAVHALTEIGVIDNPKILCGTSVGSCICLFLSIGYTGKDIYDIICELDYSTLLKDNIENIFDDAHIGLTLSDPIIFIVGYLMTQKNINTKITFKELFEKTGKTLIVSGVCLNDMSIHYFSNEKTPDMKVLKAISISISIPILFKPIKHDGKLWIDGGIMNNYPIDLFNDKLDDTIGIYMDEINSTCETFENIQNYIFQVLKCILKGLDHTNLLNYAANTVHIKCKNYSFGNNIEKSDMLQLFDNGYNTALKFINDV